MGFENINKQEQENGPENITNFIDKEVGLLNADKEKSSITKNVFLALTLATVFWSAGNVKGSKVEASEGNTQIELTVGERLEMLRSEGEKEDLTTWEQLISLKERFLGGNNGSETYKESLGGTSEDFRDELDSLTNQKGRLENVLERLEEPGSMTKSGISQEIERTKKEVEELNKKRSTLMKALR